MHGTYQHEALPYSGAVGFVPTTIDAIRAALSRSVRLIVLAAGAKLDDVRDLLGTDSSEVMFVPTDEHGRNPARITTMLDSFQAGGIGKRSGALVETVVSDEPAAVRTEACFFEAVLNLPVLQTWDLTVSCLFDTAALPPETLAVMRATHERVRGEPSPDFDPGLAHTMFAEVPADAPQGAALLDVEPPDLADMRGFVRGHAAGSGAAPDRVDDLVLAANEIVTNSLRHGGGRCRVAVWVEPASVVCEVRDAGVLTDPLLGRLPPPTMAATGRGLWLANHLCDLVQIRSSAAGTVVRLFVDR